MHCAWRWSNRKNTFEEAVPEYNIKEFLDQKQINPLHCGENCIWWRYSRKNHDVDSNDDISVGFVLNGGIFEGDVGVIDGLFVGAIVIGL